MKPRISVLSSPFFVAILILCWGFLPVSAEVPRLFLSDARLGELKKLVRTKGTHENAAYQVMKARVDSDDLLAAYPTGGGGKYEPGFRAREAALLSLLAANESEAKKYAGLSYEMTAKAAGGDIDKSHNQPGRKVSMADGYGLARAMIGMNVAITANWMQQSWSDEQNKAALVGIKKALDAWPKYGHANFGRDRASNWVAVCRGGELVMLLASGEKKSRSKRFAFLKKELLHHMKSTFGNLGVGQEGAGYIEYPGQFLLPACYAAAELGDDDLLKAARGIEWWKMVMYAYSFQPRTSGDGDRRFLQWGVAIRGPEEGWLSLLLNLVPKKELPHYLWWYDRFAGRKAKTVGGHTAFDSHRAGTTWSLIYYPSALESRDPTVLYPPAVHDDHGFAFFRNRWQDENDLQILAASDDIHHRNAWDQPDNLALRLLGQNAGFISGPGKSRDVGGFSMLLVDGKLGGKSASSYTGKTKTFEANDSGGFLVADAGKMASVWEIQSAERQTLVRFGPAQSNTGVISTLDRIKSEKSHTYIWQANLGAPGGDKDIKVSATTEAGRPGFLLEGGNGWVKGWVLSPKGARINAADPLQIETKGSDADLWVVMFTGQGVPPRATIKGEGLDSVWQLGKTTVRFNAKVGQLE